MAPIYVEQWLAAASKVHDKQRVAEMMQSANLANASFKPGTTGLHVAALYNHDLVAAQLLNENPALADATDVEGWNPIRIAAREGHEKVVAVVLAINPATAFTATEYGLTALHFAAREGRGPVIKRLLDAHPELLELHNKEGWSALHIAARNGENGAVKQLLAAKPSMIHERTSDGESVFFLASGSFSDGPQYFTRLLELDPSALRLGRGADTPLTQAIMFGRFDTIEAIQMKLPFDETMGVFATHGYSRQEELQRRLRVAVALQFEHSLTRLLHTDLVNMVLEYLGL